VNGQFKDTAALPQLKMLCSSLGRSIGTFQNNSVRVGFREISVLATILATVEVS
jgi:hypothetical protein